MAVFTLTSALELWHLLHVLDITDMERTRLAGSFCPDLYFRTLSTSDAGTSCASWMSPL